jgi:hypothetical protein
MANKGKNNKLKRKRGKKFRFFGDEANSSAASPGRSLQAVNPFEEHSASKKALKDRSKVINKLMIDLIEITIIGRI